MDETPQYWESALFRLKQDFNNVDIDDAYENSFVFCRGINIRLPKDKAQAIYDIVAGYIEEQLEQANA